MHHAREKTTCADHAHHARCAATVLTLRRLYMVTSSRVNNFTEIEFNVRDTLIVEVLFTLYNVKYNVNI